MEGKALGFLDARGIRIAHSNGSCLLRALPPFFLWRGVRSLAHPPEPAFDGAKRLHCISRSWKIEPTRGLSGNMPRIVLANWRIGRRVLIPIVQQTHHFWRPVNIFFSIFSFFCGSLLRNCLLLSLRRLFNKKAP